MAIQSEEGKEEEEKQKQFIRRGGASGVVITMDGGQDSETGTIDRQTDRQFTAACMQ